MIKCNMGLVEVHCKDLAQLTAELACLVVTIAEREAGATYKPVDVTMCDLLDQCWEYLAMKEKREGKKNG